MSEKEFNTQISALINQYFFSINQDNLALISSIFKALPVGIYWKDKDGKYLGCNDAMLKMAGVESIIGKTDFDMPWTEIAHTLRNNDLNVIALKSTLELEETIIYADKKEMVLLSRKTPLVDEKGNVIGIIGTSLDITERKAMDELQKAKDRAESALEAMQQAHLEEQKHREEMERLKLENTMHKARLEAQEYFTKMAQQVVHDIRSPLASILMIVKACEAIPERERIALRAAGTRMSDIANNLLAQYKQEHTNPATVGEVKRPVLLSATLLQLLTEKKFQYQDYNIEFNCQFSTSSQFAFIATEPSSFKRMISNLINNAADALANKQGDVTLKIDTTDEQVTITVADNGIGMLPELVEKIINNMAFTVGKVDGNGIGLTQVRETLSRNGGTLSIDSNPGHGTEIRLEFARAKAPSWVTEEITLSHQDIVVILDDDHSIHGAWDSRFASILKQAPDIKLYHFEQGHEALKFLNSLSPDDKIRTVLLTDFELLNQELNGLDVIENTNISGAILVTSHYEYTEIQKRAHTLGAKVLPKQLASEIPMIITDTQKVPSIPKPTTNKVIQAIFVDDDEVFIEHALYYFFADSDAIIHFTSPEQLKKALALNPQKYLKNTKICLDNNFHSSTIKGIQLAHELHENGYTQLYLISGDAFLPGELPEYITVLAKEDIGKIKDW